MMRYDIEETAVYIQVRTVVWEDGVARPLLPDPLDFGLSLDKKHSLIFLLYSGLSYDI
jgi:hypothetical protein